MFVESNVFCKYKKTGLISAGSSDKFSNIDNGFSSKLRRLCRFKINVRLILFSR